jgi:DNA repair protein RadC
MAKKTARITLKASKHAKKKARVIAGALGATEAVKCTAPAAGRRVTLCMRKTGKPTASITGPRAACNLLREMGNADRESIYALHLNTRHQVDGVEEIAKGTVAGVDTHPREVFKGAILNNARAIILAHNHPSGDTTPSREDIALTKQLVSAGKLLGIQVLDHVIVSDQGCRSLNETGDVSFAGAAKLFRRRK